MLNKFSKNIKETEEIAKTFLGEIFKDKNRKDRASVVALSGNLGAGKTAFTKAVAKHLGVKNKVNSPTFVIMKKYSIKTKEHNFLFHFDAYRLKNEKELLHLGWEEIVGDKENLVFIEWPENVKKIIPKHAKFVYIKNDKNGNRNFKIKSQ